MITLICPNCQKVYDVESLGNETWRVYNPTPDTAREQGLVIGPLNFEHADQLQSAINPICLEPNCVLGPDGGYLTSGPIAIPLL